MSLRSKKLNSSDIVFEPLLPTLERFWIIQARKFLFRVPIKHYINVLNVLKVKKRHHNDVTDIVKASFLLILNTFSTGI